jgi:hypothetical protein
MKLKPEPREIDLYVSNRKLTEKEFKELAEFIEAVKHTKELKKKKQRKAA